MRASYPRFSANSKKSRDRIAPPSRAERNPSSTLEISRGSIGAFIRPIIVRSDALVDRKYLHDQARRINIYRMQTTPTTSVYQRRFRNDWSNFPRYPIRDRLCPLPPVYLSLSSLFSLSPSVRAPPSRFDSDTGARERNGENATRGRAEITNSPTCYFFGVTRRTGAVRMETSLAREARGELQSQAG